VKIKVKVKNHTEYQNIITLKNEIIKNLELSNEQIELLQIIHDANDNCISGNDLAKLKINFPKLEDELQMFINKDFVEYDLSENKYYLAYEGFEILEKYNHPKSTEEEDPDKFYMRKQKTKPVEDTAKFEKITLVGILIATIIGFALVYFNDEIKKSFTDTSKDKIEEILQQTIPDIQEVIDSIQ
jgi:hypothetical protein